jgi:molecular chaperone HscB
MTSETTTLTSHLCRNCGGSAPVDAHFCPHCSKVLALGRQNDYFRFLGVPRRLQLDSADLERRFRALSRQFHPDYFYNASPAERRASLERASYLNDAYRTLKQPVARAAYLLELEGFGISTNGKQAGNVVPPSLLEEVFALNEELDGVRDLKASGAAESAWKQRLAEARRPIDARRDEHEADLEKLSVEWDAVAKSSGGQAERERILGALRERILERNYITNLLSGIERELQ